MQSLTIQERIKLKSISKIIENFKSQLTTNGFTSQQVQEYFTAIINDAFNTSQESSQKFNLNQIIVKILSNKNQSILNTLRKIQTIFYLQRISLENQYTQEVISRKSSEAISQNVKQKKKEIKQKRKKQQKDKEKKLQQHAKITKTDTFKNKTTSNIDGKILKPLNPLRQSNSSQIPKFLSSNIFSNVGPQEPVKKIFGHSEENESKQELRKNLHQISLLKQILEQKMMEDTEEIEKGQSGIYKLLDMATLMFGK